MDKPKVQKPVSVFRSSVASVTLLSATVILVSCLASAAESADETVNECGRTDLSTHSTGRAPLSFSIDQRIRVNQVGMRPNQLKLVVVAGHFSSPPEFQIVDERGITRFSSRLDYFGFDSDSREDLWRGDFSAFRLKGTYRIKVEKGFSYPFAISDSVYRNLAVLATRWLYLQRSGVEVNDSVTGVSHRKDHASAAFLRDRRGIHFNHAVDTSGGWWDAGDYGRYVPPATSTIMSLHYAYRFNPKLFRDGSLQIPESRNGVPDLLDEMKWELQWLLKMQRTDGAVHQKTATREYADVRPAADTQTIYLFDVTSQATAQFAGALSEVSIVYRQYDRPFADRLLAAAKSAWTWLEQNPEKYPTGGFRNPDDENGGDYAVSGDETGHQLWAAAGLLHATGDSRYADAFRRLWDRRDKAAKVYGLSWGDGYAFGMFAYLDAPAGDADIKAQIRNVVAQQSQLILQTIQTTGYRVALRGNRSAFGYQWGSNFLALNYATYLLLASDFVSRHPGLEDGAASQLNWLLGVNPLQKTFVTGLGANPVRSPHHVLSIVRGKAVPGAVAGGPNAMQLGGDPVLRLLFDADVPFSKRYADDRESWATNEPAIYGNAALIAVASWFAN